jgi:hypothetical protein
VYFFQIAWALNKTPELLARDFFRLGSDMHRGTAGMLAEVVDRVARPRIERNFETDSAGLEPWEPLAESTVERKGSEEILTDSGRLERAAPARARWSIDRHQAVLRGSSLPEGAWYGQLHQHGSEAFDVAFPARPWGVLATPEDADAAADVAGDWFDRHAREAGF